MPVTINNIFGAETGGAEEVSATTGSPDFTEATVVHSGIRSVLLAGAATAAEFRLTTKSGTVEERIIGFAIRTNDTTPTAAVTLCTGNVTGFSIVLETSGDITVKDVTGTTRITASDPLTVDIFSYIELYWQQIDSGGAELFIDGTSQGTTTGRDFKSVNIDVYVFSGGTTVGEDIYIDDVYDMVDGTAATDRLGGTSASEMPEVFGYQSSHATNQDIGDALANGEWDEAGDTPGVEEANGTAVELAGASSTTADTDMDAANARGQAGGPSSGSPDVSGTIHAAKFVFNLKRTNGSGTSMGYRYGNDADGVTSSGDIEASLTTSYAIFETVSEAAAVVPLSSEDFRIGLEAGTTDTGGREIFMADGWAMLLHVPDAAVTEDTDPYWIAAGQQQPRFDPPEIIGY